MSAGKCTCALSLGYAVEAVKSWDIDKLAFRTSTLNRVLSEGVVSVFNFRIDPSAPTNATERGPTSSDDAKVQQDMLAVVNFTHVETCDTTLPRANVSKYLLLFRGIAKTQLS